jgi:hypothetical protein
MKIPYADVLKLATKIIRYSRGGFTPTEISDLVADLLDLAAVLTQLEAALAPVENTVPTPAAKYEGHYVR